MLKKHLAACVAATALMTATAIAQTSPASPSGNQPTMSQPGAAQPMNQPNMNQPMTTTEPATGAPAAGSTMSGTTMSGAAGDAQVLTQMQANQMRGSKLMGVDVYGADNERIGEIDELIVDRTGSIEAIVVGVGGFLGIGEKNVAIPFEQVQFMSEEQAEAMASNQDAPRTTGGVATPTTPMTTGSTGQAATTTGTTGQATTTAGAADDGEPDRAMVRMTRADLQNAPEFRYQGEREQTGATGATGNTNPPANANRPGTQPQ